MVVNESENVFATFMDKHSRKLMDNICLLQDGVYNEGMLMEKEIEPNQKFCEATLPHNKSRSIGNGSLMKYLSEGTSIIVVIANVFRTSAGKQRYKIRPLNGITTSVSVPSQIK